MDMQNNANALFSVRELAHCEQNNVSCHKKRKYVLSEKGRQWKKLVQFVKDQPCNKGKNMREIHQIAAQIRKNYLENDKQRIIAMINSNT